MEEKKRFSFNIIDVIAVLLILAVLAFAGIRHFGAKSDGDVRETVKVTYWVKAEGVDASLYENCEKYLPCRLMASGALLPGSIESVERQAYLVPGPDGQWLEDPDHVNLIFKATVNVEKQSVMLTKVGDQEVRVGKPHLLKGEWIEIYNTVIVDVVWGE